MAGEEPMGDWILIEDFTPFPLSLEWQTASAYWGSRGFGAFLSDGVPHLITNDGVRATRAADVLYASCESARADGTLEPEITVAELGPGLGTHALLLLDRFAQRCRDDGRDHYDRLTFVLADSSPAMLADLAGSGTFDRHQDRVRFRLVDAAHSSGLADLGAASHRVARGLRAVVHNYLLATLPVEVLAQWNESWYRLHTRTWLRSDRQDLLAALDPGLTVEDPGGTLHELSRSFHIESAYLPANLAEIPHASIATGLAGASEGRSPLTGVVLPNRAIDSVLGTLALLRPDGFLLFSDYGTPDLRVSPLGYQHYGGSRSVPLSLWLLERTVIAEAPSVEFVVPPGETEPPIHARLVCAPGETAARRAFFEGFDESVFDDLRSRLHDAHSAREAGRLDEAVRVYMAARERYPESWYLPLEEAETRLALGDASGASDLAQSALAKNPTGSLVTREVLADALVALGRYEEAEAHYRYRLAVRHGGARAAAGLAWCLALQQRYAEAIAEVAAALAADDEDERRATLTAVLERILDARHAAHRA